MTTNHLNADDLFFQAIEFSTEEEQEQFLRQACGTDNALFQRVQKLLHAQRRSSRFLEDPVVDLDRTIDDSRRQEGERIGPYKILQKLGEGGMGIVYMAEQTEPVKRRVALKIIKPGMDSRQIIARFKAEQQALAMMEHPNIARVFEAGTTESGRPYFVMELVKGIPITKYCDDNQLSTSERLALFGRVCSAIEHAHQKGIIHRDIKPSNVLVAEYDDHPSPKVIDFGVAKAIGQELVDATMFTRFGQILGTFEYMSPEQAKLNQWDIDTRSDIYSLGVLMYELLTGNTPFDRERLKDAAIDEVLRIIREEEPMKPSAQLTTSASLPDIAGKRNIDPQRLGKAIRGELDWIVMTALEKDRRRRYQTAGALAQDVENHLQNEPVMACPPSLGYRLRKFSARNRVALTTIALIFLLLIVGTGVATYFAGEAIVLAEEARLAKEVALQEAERARAAEERARAETQSLQVAIQLLTHEIGHPVSPDNDGRQPSTVTLLEGLTRGEEKLDPNVEALARIAVANALRRQGHRIKAKQHYERAYELLTSASVPGLRKDVLRRLIALEDDGIQLQVYVDEMRPLLNADHLDVNTVSLLARDLANSGRAKHGIQLAKMAQSLLDSFDSSDLKSTIASVHYRLAHCYVAAGQYKNAAEQYGLAAECFRAAEMPVQRVRSLRPMAHALLPIDQFREATLALEEALEIAEIGAARNSELRSEVFKLSRDLARLHRAAGTVEAAIEYAERCLESNTATLMTRRRIGVFYHHLGEYEKAAQVHTGVAAEYAARDDTLNQIIVLRELAQTFEMHGQAKEAAEAYSRATDIGRVSDKPDCVRSASYSRFGLAKLHSMYRNHDAAADTFLSAAELRKRASEGADTPAVVDAMRFHAMALHEQGKNEDAIAAYRDTLQRFEQCRSRYDKVFGEANNILFSLLVRFQIPDQPVTLDEALIECQRAEALAGGDAHTVGAAKWLRGVAYLRDGQVETARTILTHNRNAMRVTNPSFTFNEVSLLELEKSVGDLQAGADVIKTGIEMRRKSKGLSLPIESRLLHVDLAAIQCEAEEFEQAREVLDAHFDELVSDDFVGVQEKLRMCEIAQRVYRALGQDPLAQQWAQRAREIAASQTAAQSN